MFSSNSMFAVCRMCRRLIFQAAGTFYFCLILSVYPTEAQNNTAVPVSWPFNTSRHLGPDGPWYSLDIQIGWSPEQVSVYPGAIPGTLVISNAVCSRLSANCSNPGVGFYDRNPPSDTVFGSDDLDVRKLDIPGWNSNFTNPLRLNGTMRQATDRITIADEDGGVHYVDDVAILISDDLKIDYAGGIQLSLDIGILSVTSKIPNKYARSGYYNRPVHTPLGFLGNVSIENMKGVSTLPSLSWGLHVGSAQQNLSGSFLFGAFDQSRVLEPPGTFNNNTTVSISNISFNSTIPAFISTGNLLSTLNTPSLSVVLEPALPYLYLPSAICTALASHLPLVYNAGLELYIWDTTHPALLTLLSSLSTLSFTFVNSSNAPSTISVPLALLNLTLTPPLVTTPTPYFPCRPYEPNPSIDPVYYLGRAFLQSAFLGQNYESGTTFLAQAPGPSFLPTRIVNIDSGDVTIPHMQDAPS